VKPASSPNPSSSRAGGDRIEAIDTYEPLPSGALLHLVDAHVGDQKVEGAEVFGYDPIALRPTSSGH
jgi:hypothetical protein